MQRPSTPPPLICVNDRVLLHYAVLTESLGLNRGHGLHFVGEKELGPVPCLAICQDKESGKFVLCYCESDWSPVGIGASYNSVDAAKRRAERIYPGSSACWTPAEFTVADAERFLDEQFSDLRCSSLCFRAGMNGFLAKPVSPEALRAEIERIVSQTTAPRDPANLIPLA